MKRLMYAAFCPCLDIYSIAPLERYALVFFYLQGGGLYILGTATMTNTNVYSNEARYVRWPCALAYRHFIHRPAGTLRVLMTGSLAGDSTSRARQR